MFLFKGLLYLLGKIKCRQKGLYFAGYYRKILLVAGNILWKWTGGEKKN